MNVDAGVGRRWAGFLPCVITPAKEAGLGGEPVSHTDYEVFPRGSIVLSDKQNKYIYVN